MDASVPQLLGQLHQLLATDLGTLVAIEGISLSGRVSDSDGEPIADATVEATWGDLVAPRSRRDLTDEEGRYRLDGLDDAPVRVEASADGFVRLDWGLVGEDGEDRLAEHAVTVRCLQRADGGVPVRDDEPDLVAYVARAY